MSDIKPLNFNKTGFKKRISKKLIIGVVIILVIGFMWIVWSEDSVFNFVFGEGSSLKKDQGQINILLLGIAGKGHDGPNLTDTIMVASYNAKNHKLSLVSLPRDLWVDKHKAKVNVLYQLGINKGDGLKLSQEEIGGILGIKIPYGVRVDFAGFVKAVDLVGGVDVEVAKSFDDYSYPTAGKENELCGYEEKEMDLSLEQASGLGVDPGIHKVLLGADGSIATSSAKIDGEIEYSDDAVYKFFPCRFEHISFTKGTAHMDGATALKFARSRHGTNKEGTDFARSRRQQQVLQAFKNKVFSLGTLTDPQKIISLVQTFGDSIDTNISGSQYPALIKMVKQIETTQSYSIDSNGDNPLLINPPTVMYGAWVLTPPDNDFTKIQKYVDDILSGKLEASSSAQQN